MVTSIKHTCKITSHLFICTGCIASLFFAGPAYPANVPPTADDINHLAETARLIGDTFMQKSFELRMKYEYSGKFVEEDDKNGLCKLAKEASDSLQAIAEQQQELKRKIEDYQGADWDDRYGSTGLWRKLAEDLYAAKLAKCEADYYTALIEWSPINKTLNQLRERIISLDENNRSANSQLLKAKILALVKIDSAWRTLAMDIIDSLMTQPDINEAIYFRAAIEKLKLVHIATPESFDLLINKISQSNCSNDFDLILPLAFLQRRYDPKAFEKIVHLRPETEDFLGSLILSELSSNIESGQLCQTKLHRISVFEAELAVLAAWKNETEDYKMLLELLIRTEKFRTPLILYATAVASVESSPAEAVSFLVKASRLQQLQKSAKLDVKADKIAEQAARLAYNSFAEDALGCESALEAFENYLTIADNKIDENLEYLHTIVLNDCGDTEKGKRLLEKIANRPTRAWRNRAKLDLIIQQLGQSQGKDQGRRNELFEQLKDFILSCKGQNSSSLRMEAISIYCQSLLETKDESSAQKVLAILDEAESTPGIQLDLFKSKALQQLGELDKSIRHMLLAIREDSGSLGSQVNELLFEVIETIDQLQFQVDDFDGMIQDCKKLAEFSYKSLNDVKSALYLAEISVFAAGKERNKLSAAEKLLTRIAQNGNAEDVDLLRCRARLLTEQGEFEKAAGLWCQICKIRRNETALENQRSWKWWRAKFYELYCCAKMPQTKKKEVLHTIEVLQNSFSNIPPLWFEKLSSLKQEID